MKNENVRLDPAPCLSVTESYNVSHLQKPSRHISEQSLGVGTIAECLQAMGPATAAFVQHLYPLISKLLGHDDNEVRSNSMFAMGVLAGNGGEAIYSYPWHNICSLCFTFSVSGNDDDDDDAEFT